MIQLDSVSKIYQKGNQEIAALDNVSLQIDSGEFVAVRGPSGCGKSTLLALVGGLTTPSAGRVEVLGQDLSQLNTNGLAAFRSQNIGFVFQLFHLLPYLNVLDNVLVASPTSNNSAAREAAEKMLIDFGLASRLTHHPAELSIGERQRVAMVRAMLNEPQVLLADEPTGNLDPDSAKIVLDLLAKFNASGGTVLLVTHDEFSASYAKRTILLRSGKLSGSAQAEEQVAS